MEYFVNLAAPEQQHELLRKLLPQLTTTQKQSLKNELLPFQPTNIDSVLLMSQKKGTVADRALVLQSIREYDQGGKVYLATILMLGENWDLYRDLPSIIRNTDEKVQIISYLIRTGKVTAGDMYALISEWDPDLLSLDDFEELFLDDTTLVKVLGVDINFLLMSAIRNTDTLELIEILLEAGADPTFYENQPLILAAENDRVEVVSILLDYDQVDPNSQNGAALETALRNDWEEVVSVLLQDYRVEVYDNHLQLVSDDEATRRLMRKYNKI